MDKKRSGLSLLTFTYISNIMSTFPSTCCQFIHFKTTGQKNGTCSHEAEEKADYDL